MHRTKKIKRLLVAQYGKTLVLKEENPFQYHSQIANCRSAQATLVGSNGYLLEQKQNLINYSTKVYNGQF